MTVYWREDLELRLILISVR